jgi:NAD(P)-dependent dehydrogenase (short-subunit alcohol dehydrogenase family)
MGKHLLISGGAIAEALAKTYAGQTDVERVTLTWHRRVPRIDHPAIALRQLDLTDEGAVAGLVGSLPQLDGVINCAGFLHGKGPEGIQSGPEKSIAHVSSEQLLKSIELNTLPTLLLAKHTRLLLRKSPSAYFAAISARVGSIEENALGGWYSYRASKAALNMVLKTLSIEWQRALPRCSVAALHPGTVASRLSAPFTGSVPDGKLFTPEQSAAYIAAVIEGLTPEITGRFWSWDGTELPW